MVEVGVNEQGNIEFLMDKLDIVLALLAMGFTIGLVVAVVFAGARIGWKLWPWVLAVGLVAYIIT